MHRTVDHPSLHHGHGARHKKFDFFLMNVKLENILRNLLNLAFLVNRDLSIVVD